MADNADMFDNDTKRNKFFLNFFFKDSKDKIDFDGSDIINLINITEGLPEIETDKAEKEVVYKATSNGTL